MTDGVLPLRFPKPMCNETEPYEATGGRRPVSSRTLIAVVSLVFLASLGRLVAGAAPTAQAYPGTGYVVYFGYSEVVLLEIASTRVVLCQQAGARVLEYSLHGRNVIWLDPQQRGWEFREGASSLDPCGGRFDIGPEMLVPRRTALWLGAWRAELIGPRAARLTSAEDPATGVQLVREFKLDPSSSRLQCTQTIRNVSQKPRAWCHWSRTLAVGGGIAIVPLTPHSRFPKSYVMYEDRSLINPRPDDPNIRERDGFLEVVGPPKFRKLGMDSQAGWFAYAAPNDLLFVKRYPVFPQKLYGEVAGLTISIWYDAKIRCELEPIGPLEQLAPGAAASFTEEWQLEPFPFPPPGTSVDLQRVRALAEVPR